MFRKLTLATALTTGLVAHAAVAQEVVVPEDMRKDVLKAAKPQGFTNKLSLGATAAFNRSDSVVGSVDGTTVALGLLVDGSSELVQEQFELLNTLKVQEGLSRTPQVPVFAKTVDMAEFVSTAIYRLSSVPWFGPYARLRANSQLFDSYAIKPLGYTVTRTNTDGAKAVSKSDALNKIDVSSALQPLVLAETVGAFANPVESKMLTLKVKLGAGAQEVISGGGYTVAKEDAKAQTLDLKQVQGATQVGAEAELAANGELTESVAWKAKANTFVPVYTSVGKVTGVDAMTTDLSFGMGVKLAKWLSVDYTLSARKVPLVADVWQLQNGIMLTAGFKL